VTDNRLRGSLAQRLEADLGAAAEHSAIFGDWTPVLQRWRASPEGLATLAAVDARVAAGAVVYPADPFTALRLTPRAATRVLILGQDPYHGPGQAEGLAFSVPAGCKPPPSLRNIHAELGRDLGLPRPTHGSLRAWAAQGVLLLNTTLTVEDGQAGSHAHLCWQLLTSAICKVLSDADAPIIAMLWGAHAQRHWRAAAGAGPSVHIVLACNHPSPLAARRPPVPFVGCGHFGRANAALAAAGRPGVDWRLPAAA
jgi:uracil-DNA glycosylase